jgi:hypothetical protein
MPKKLRTSFVGHPSAILFLRILGEGVFQQPRLIASTEYGLCNTDADEALANARNHERRWSVWGVACTVHDSTKHACLDMGCLQRRFDAARRKRQYTAMLSNACLQQLRTQDSRRATRERITTARVPRLVRTGQHLDGVESSVAVLSPSIRNQSCSSR